MLFKNAKKHYIHVHDTYCTYTNEYKSSKYTLDIFSVKELVFNVINETYIQFGGQIFKQTMGVPMGGAASPDLADLTLSVLEYRYLKQNPAKQYQLTCTSRYIDDIITVGTADFMDIAKRIYPQSIVLEKTNQQSNDSSFLDLKITIRRKTPYSKQITHDTGAHDNQFSLHFDLYDKRKDFGFTILKFPRKHSNVSNTVIKNVITSQSIRAARICSDYDGLVAAVAEICSVTLTNGHSSSVFLESIFRTLSNHHTLFFKFKIVSKLDWIKFSLKSLKHAKRAFSSTDEAEEGEYYRPYR